MNKTGTVTIPNHPPLKVEMRWIQGEHEWRGRIYLPDGVSMHEAFPSGMVVVHLDGGGTKEVMLLDERRVAEFHRLEYTPEN